MKQYTLSELCAEIEDALQMELNPTYWVKAEIVELSTRGGHCYMELAEKAENGIHAAKLRATCWSNIYTMLGAYFQEETGSKLQAGMQVLVEVEVRFHAVYGLSLNVINIDPAYTIGGLAQQRQKTIARLQAEGIMDMQKSLRLPSLCLRLAVISSEKAAGYEDFTNQLSQSGFLFTSELFSAVMQGENAGRSMIEALSRIAAEEERWDAVVIIRGGGASADLTCFDDYELCSHCAQFPLPILTGIGHTKDVSILDMVAQMSLKTPTAVAAFLTEHIQIQQSRLDDLRRRLKQTAERQVMIRKHKIEMLWQAIQMHSPERIYQKGYSLLTSNGKIVRNINELSVGSIIETHLRDGIATSRVEKLTEA
jgi:exodeoxyribonuclease VII large subunit